MLTTQHDPSKYCTEANQAEEPFPLNSQYFSCTTSAAELETAEARLAEFRLNSSVFFCQELYVFAYEEASLGPVLQHAQHGPVAPPLCSDDLA